MKKFYVVLALLGACLIAGPSVQAASVVDVERLEQLLLAKPEVQELLLKLTELRLREKNQGLCGDVKVTIGAAQKKPGFSDRVLNLVTESTWTAAKLVLPVVMIGGVGYRLPVVRHIIKLLDILIGTITTGLPYLFWL